MGNGGESMLDFHYVRFCAPGVLEAGDIAYLSSKRDGPVVVASHDDYLLAVPLNQKDSSSMGSHVGFIDGTAMVVENVTFEFDPNAASDGNPQLGDLVLDEGVLKLVCYGQRGLLFFKVPGMCVRGGRGS